MESRSLEPRTNDARPGDEPHSVNGPNLRNESHKGRDSHSRNDVYSAMCPCRDMLNLLANKWSALAIGALEEGPRRFGQLAKRLAGVSPKVLSHTLKRLESHGLLTRTVYPEIPPRVEYELSGLGHSAAVPLKHLRQWVEQNTQSNARETSG